MLSFKERDKQKYFEENYWSNDGNLNQTQPIHVVSFLNFINLYCTFTHTSVTYFTVTSN